ncbi:MAG TPA: hypothetical protein DCQ94_03815 [Nitrospira sp.]|nr:hypothetical protein [Nitrospira sp.]
MAFWHLCLSIGCPSDGSEQDASLAMLWLIATMKKDVCPSSGCIGDIRSLNQKIPFIGHSAPFSLNKALLRCVSHDAFVGASRDF